MPPYPVVAAPPGSRCRCQRPGQTGYARADRPDRGRVETAQDIERGALRLTLRRRLERRPDVPSRLPAAEHVAHSVEVVADRQGTGPGAQRPDPDRHGAVHRRRPPRRAPVQVWTVNDEAATHRLLDLGVDGLMTNRLELPGNVSAERGLVLAASNS